MSLPDPLPPLADEAALLRLYQAAPGEAAFRQLVALHLPLVWSTARRLVHGDASLADDVTQIVFADFARKAPALPPDTIAAGWLHRHTCFTARKMVRTEVRRRIREHSAAQMLIDDAMPADPHPLWPEAAPHLDAALDRLSRPDREALLLRFWQRQDHRLLHHTQFHVAHRESRRGVLPRCYHLAGAKQNDWYRGAEDGNHPPESAGRSCPRKW